MRLDCPTISRSACTLARAAVPMPPLWSSNPMRFHAVTQGSSAGSMVSSSGFRTSFGWSLWGWNDDAEEFQHEAGGGESVDAVGDTGDVELWQFIVQQIGHQNSELP